MQCKRRAGILAVLTIFLAVLCLAAPAMGATWMVNPDGTGDFTTIQAALDSEWTSGDTIEIAYAVYKEPVAVNATGCDLTITGIPSPAGDLPVIDGMDGAVELPGLYHGYFGCGACAMYLLDGNFTVSSLCVTNASHNGLVVLADGTLEITDVEATGNGYHGINVHGCNEVVLTGIIAGENGWYGIHVGEQPVSLVGTDLFCADNGWDGLKASAREYLSLTSVESVGNGFRGMTVHTAIGGGRALLTDIVVSGNGDDGLMAKGSWRGPSGVEITDVTSTGNGGDGVVIRGYSDFAVSRVETDGNGVEPELPPAILADRADTEGRCCWYGADGGTYSEAYGEADAFLCTAEADAVMQATGIACDLRYEGNGLFIVQSGNGTIEDVTATNNPSVGIVVDATGDVVISDVTADENGYLGILTMSVSDDYPLCADLISEIDADMDADAAAGALGTFFTGMSTAVANATVVSEDEFILGEGVFVFVENVTEDGPDVNLTTVSANGNGYAGIGVLAPYVVATDITTDGNGVSPTNAWGTLSGAGIVGASFVGQYSGVDAVENGGAGMAAASLLLGIADSTFTGNGEMAASDIHGPLFQTGLLTVSLVNSFFGVHADQNAGSGILMTSVMTGCFDCTASGNDYAGIVAADPLSLGIAALLVHSDLSGVLDAAEISEEDRFYLESLSTPAMQDVVACYDETDTFASSAAADIDIDDVTEEDVAVLIDLLHQYMALSGCYMMQSGADDNGLFGMVAVYPNIAASDFSADGNGNDGGSPLEALLGTGIFGLYLTGDFFDISVSENSGAGMVTIGVVSEYEQVTADDNGYAGIVTIDPVTLAAATLGAYFVVLDDGGEAIFLTSADASSAPGAPETPETTDIAMHADIAESAVLQEIVATYYTGAPGGEVSISQVDPSEDDPMEILLEHIEFYFTYAGVYASDVSASGNGYPGFVAIGPNVVMNDVTADRNGAANDDESDVIGLAAGSGVIGLSIAGNYSNIAASGNTGAGIATAGVLTDIADCEADENGIGVVSLFVVGDHTEVLADENRLSGIILAGINGTLADAEADNNAGPGIVCVDPVAAALMYLTFSADSPDVPRLMATGDAAAPYPETMVVLSQFSAASDGVSCACAERETAWSLIAWAVDHISSYEGDIADLNESEMMDLLLSHYLMGAEFTVTDVSADENGWQGIVVLSPSIMVQDVSANDNGYHGIALISPWKAVDAMGFAHPDAPVGDERLSVARLGASRNEGAGLAISGANGGYVTDTSCLNNLVGTLLGDSDHLLVTDCTWDKNLAGSVLCGGSRMNSLLPAEVILPDGALTDPTGSCDNVFANTAMDTGVVVLSNGTGNQFIDTFLDCNQEISADISGDGPYIVYSTSGSWSPVLPPCPCRNHMGGCGIGVVGVAGWNTTVNVTYDYSHSYPLEYGEKLYPMWAVNATTPWDSWRFNPVGNDKVAMTVGPMEVPVCCPASVPAGEFVDVMYIAPFWQEEESADDTGHDAFVASLEENRHGYLNAQGVFVPYGPGEVPPVDTPPGAPVAGAGDGTGDGTGADGDDSTLPQQSGGDGDGDGSTPAGASATPGATATTAAATGTPVATTTPAGVLPVCGALSILGAAAVLRRR